MSNLHMFPCKLIVDTITQRTLFDLRYFCTADHKYFRSIQKDHLQSFAATKRHSPSLRTRYGILGLIIEKKTPNCCDYQTSRKDSERHYLPYILLK